MNDMTRSWLLRNINIVLAFFIVLQVAALAFIAATEFDNFSRSFRRLTSNNNRVLSANNFNTGFNNIARLENEESGAVLTAGALDKLEQSYTNAIATVKPAIVFIETVAATWPVINSDKAAGNKIGSGVIVDEEGFIVTNYHVIKDAKTVYVTPCSAEKRRYTASVVRFDEVLDLALIKINAPEGFIAAILGNSDDVRAGDRVLAVGSPFGFEHTVTHGIISDESRALAVGSSRYENMLQTDAAVNRGNSGGALIDLKGYVIGITTAIYAPDGAFNGLSFAIPAGRVRKFLSSVAYSE